MDWLPACPAALPHAWSDVQVEKPTFFPWDSSPPSRVKVPLLCGGNSPHTSYWQALRPLLLFKMPQMEMKSCSSPGSFAQPTRLFFQIWSISKCWCWYLPTCHRGHRILFIQQYKEHSSGHSQIFWLYPNYNSLQTGLKDFIYNHFDKHFLTGFCYKHVYLEKLKH